MAFCLPLRFALGTFCLTATIGLSQQPSPNEPKAASANQANVENDAFSLDLDSLANTKVTTASKFSEKISDAPSVITVVSQDELKRFSGLTLGEVLNRVAGLNSSSGFFQDRSTIAIRGDQSRVDSGHVLILLNGRPIREILEGGVSSDVLESFPIKILERIEVIKGPGSVLYGSGAFTGVINLITKKAVGTSVDVSAAGGAAGAATTSGEILWEKSGLNVVAAGQYHQMPVWNTTFGSLKGPTNPQSIQNVSLRNDGEGGYLGINFKGLSFMSSYTGAEGASFVRGFVGDVRWKRGFTDLGYSLKASAKWNMSFNLTYGRELLDEPYYPRVHRDSSESLVEWTNFVTFTDRDRLTFGTLFNHISGVETLLTTPNVIDAHGTRSGVGFYAQHEHKLTDDLKLIGGFQANKIGTLALNVVPRVGILWNPASHFTLKALYGGAFRAPSIDETLLNHPALKGNPNLVPETVGTLDLQASYQSNRLQLSVDYFHSRQDNLIVEDASGFPAKYINLATPATFHGFDSEEKFYLEKNWYLTGGALYQRNNDSALKTALSPISSVSAKAGVSYEGSTGLTASIFDAYQGHVPRYSPALNPRPDAFHSVNAHLRFDVSKHWIKNDQRGLALFAYGDNLTNIPVWLPDWGSGTQNTLPVNRGRTLFFGVEVWQKAE